MDHRKSNNSVQPCIFQSSVPAIDINSRQFECNNAHKIPTYLHRYFDITLVQPLILHLLDITPMMGVLNGVVMEISVRKNIYLNFLP